MFAGYGTLVVCTAKAWDSPRAGTVPFLLPFPLKLVPFYGVPRTVPGQTCTRTLKGEDFLWLVLQHVLPKGFRRVRDYGFLHGNAKRVLRLVQLVLRVMVAPFPVRPRPVFRCPHCKAAMKIIAFRRPAYLTG